MSLKLITAPAVEPVTLAEARLHLRLDAEGSPATHADDDLVTNLIAAARQHIDGRDGWLGRALVTQTWDLILDRFPLREIRVPLPPLQSVTSLTYLDPAGDAQTLTENTDFEIDTASQPGWIVPGVEGWPATFDGINTVTVRFVAGYGAAAAVPSPVKAAILLMVGHLYSNREAVTEGSAVVLPMGADALLSTYRVMAF